MQIQEIVCSFYMIFCFFVQYFKVSAPNCWSAAWYCGRSWKTWAREQNMWNQREVRQLKICRYLCSIDSQPRAASGCDDQSRAVRTASRCACPGRTQWYRRPHRGRWPGRDRAQSSPSRRPTSGECVSRALRRRNAHAYRSGDDTRHHSDPSTPSIISRGNWLVWFWFLDFFFGRGWNLQEFKYGSKVMRASIACSMA